VLRLVFHSEHPGSTTTGFEGAPVVKRESASSTPAMAHRMMQRGRFTVDDQITHLQTALKVPAHADFIAREITLHNSPRMPNRRLRFVLAIFFWPLWRRFERC